MRYQQHTNCDPKQSYAREGFALIATISVLVLLVMIALAMLSLSSITLREAQNADHQATAQANARMALMLALGELQKNAGADQRVTARADIIAGAANGQEHWTGFWSTANWSPLNPDKRDFLGWGVSSPLPLLSTDDVKNTIPESQAVTMVGAGSVSDPGDHVVAHRIDTLDGSYAWWISDEAVKASFSTPQTNANAWNRAGLLGTPANSGISALELDRYSSLDESQMAASTVSRNSMNVPLGSNKATREFFHDITPQVITLLTDTRHGGLRKDLSTAFELDREDFDAIEEFHASKEQNGTDFYNELGTAYTDSRFYPASASPEMGYVCEIPHASGFVRGPTWDLVRNHYRLYKKEWENTPWARSVPRTSDSAFAARGTLPHSYSGIKGGTNDSAGDTFAYHTSNGAIYSKASSGSYGHSRPVNESRGTISSKRTVSRSPGITPRVIRVSFAMGLVKKKLGEEDWSLAVSLDPYITIINPYNVPITFDSLGLWSTKFTPFIVTVKYTDQGGAERTVRFEKYFSANYYSHGTFAVRLDPKQGPYTLEPGEIKVMSPSKIGAQGQLSYNYITTIKGGFPYSEDSGLHIAPNNDVRPKDGSTVEVTLNGREPSWGATDRVIVTLEHSKTHTGSPLDIFAHFPPRDMYGDEDIFDQPLICNLGISANDNRTQPNFYVKKSVGTSQIPSPGESGLYLGVLDIKMKTIAEDFPSLSVNPRGEALDTRDYDGSDRSSPQWDISLVQIDDLSQLQLVANPAGQALWGEGRTVSNGSTHCVLYEIPELPLTSLAQLQHLNTGVTGSSGSLQIGNSFPHPGIRDLTKIADQRSTVSNGYSSVTSQVLSDMSWANNEALWDRYYFSGINWGNTSSARLGGTQTYDNQPSAIAALIASDRTTAWPLQNPRMGLFHSRYDSANKAELMDYDKLAKHLVIFGGFNINSTSKNAWKAVFSSLRDVDVNMTGGSGTNSRHANNVFSRFLVPTQQNGQIFGAYRELSDHEIDTLAKEMVKQVQVRGPFMGLSDFVNRRIKDETIDGTDMASCGALQAAIEAAGLNGTSVNKRPTASNIENVSYQVGGVDRNRSNYAGSSAYLQQADILNSIGSIISARSDTFIIRAYGTAKDKHGNTLATAWCEATIQRSTEWLEPTDATFNELLSPPEPSLTSPVHTSLKTNASFPKINRSMGRKFSIQSFRWLNGAEI